MTTHGRRPLLRPAVATLAFLAAAWLASTARAEDGWEPVRGGTAHGISGMAPVTPFRGVDAGPTQIYLVVHDNKDAKADGPATGAGPKARPEKLAPRLGLVTLAGRDPPRYEPLDWPAAEGDQSEAAPPKDLEAVAAVPHEPWHFLAMTSAGEVYHLHLTLPRDDDNDDDDGPPTLRVEHVAGENKFDPASLPPGVNADGNADADRPARSKDAVQFEGLDVFALADGTWAVWAERGLGGEPAVLRWVGIDPKTFDTRGPVLERGLKCDWPTGPDVRHAADVRVDERGVLFVAAATDPGNEGPFHSAVYLAGFFTAAPDGTHLHFAPHRRPSTLLRSRAHKVEAIEVLPGRHGGLILASDDEDGGSSIRAGW